MLFCLLFPIQLFALKLDLNKNAIVGTWHTKRLRLVMYFGNQGGFEIRIIRKYNRSRYRHRRRVSRALPPVIKKGKWYLKGNILTTDVRNNGVSKTVKYRVFKITRKMLKLKIIGRKHNLVFKRFLATFAQPKNTRTTKYRKDIVGKWMLGYKRTKVIFRFYKSGYDKRFSKTVFRPGEKKSIYQGSWSIYGNILRISGGGYHQEGYYIILKITKSKLFLLGIGKNPVVFSKK